MTMSPHPAPFPYPGPYAPAPVRHNGVTALRVVGIVLQSVLAGSSVLVLLFVTLFIDDPDADVGLILSVLAGIGLWCVCGPFLYWLLTRSTRSAAWTVLSFFACGPMPLLAVLIVVNLR
jgi:hypothetical protein